MSNGFKGPEISSGNNYLGKNIENYSSITRHLVAVTSAYTIPVNRSNMVDVKLSLKDLVSGTDSKLEIEANKKQVEEFLNDSQEKNMSDLVGRHVLDAYYKDGELLQVRVNKFMIIDAVQKNYFNLFRL